jgi:hypothetical protein
MEERYLIGIVQPAKNKKEEDLQIIFECNDREFMEQFNEVLSRFYRIYNGEIRFGSV